MPDDELTRAEPADVENSIQFALRYRRSGKPTREHDYLLAGPAAAHIVEALRLSGFVIMRRKPVPNHAGAVPEHAPGWAKPGLPPDPGTD